MCLPRGLYCYKFAERKVMKFKVRSCIYCGRELEKGEKCNCPSAVVRRSANASQERTQKSENKTSDGTYSYSAKNNSYYTGYTKKENPIKSAWNKYTQRKKAARSQNSTVRKRHRRNIFFDAVSFIKSPITTIYNPGEMSMAFIFAVIALSGIATSLGAYTLFARIINGAASIKTGSINISMIMSGINGLSGVAIFAVISTIISIIAFFVYCGCLYIINKFVMRCNISFRDFISRLVLCPICIAFASIAALVFGIFSTTIFALFMFCGIASWIILTYESLKTLWSSKTPNQVLYGMLAGLLLAGVVLWNVMWLI